MARTESRSRHSKEAATGERIWTAKRTSLTHLERRITEETEHKYFPRRSTLYRDNCQSGGSVIAERLYIDVGQDFSFFNKNKKKE